MYPPLQITPASSLWSHPLAALMSMVQFSRFMSSLVQPVLDKWTGPIPSPKNALLVGIPRSTCMECMIVICIHVQLERVNKAIACIIRDTKLHLHHSYGIFCQLVNYAHIIKCIPDSPSCLHTVVASLISHPSSHTVPQKLSRQTSTLPLWLLVPLASLSSPFWHSS